MATGISEFYMTVFAFVVVFFLAFFIMNFLTNSFLFTFLRVKSSRGKNNLVRVFTISHAYFRVGFVHDGFLVYKDSKKKEKRLAVDDPAVFYRSFNLTCVDVDEEKNCVFNRNIGVDGFDAAKYNGLYTRTLCAPKLDDNMTQIVIVLLVLIFLAAVIGAGIAFSDRKIDQNTLTMVTAIKDHFVMLNTTII